jgi:hypothetical protein
VPTAAYGSAWETETDLREASRALVKFLFVTVAIGILRLAHSSWLVGCGDEEANGIVYNTPSASQAIPVSGRRCDDATKTLILDHGKSALSPGLLGCPSPSSRLSQLHAWHCVRTTSVCSSRSP